ncbi:hypothetical protein B0H16DRAFT_1597761 [Mycena metata]|uniref:Cell wall protein n=1 Tax=Mycena metata TaxID=1033252 RepID=A0AAD7HNM8_9AGAR|nr:hypothetical protein B0H16DRAFT_1597761 [Mycena metata]
MAHILISLVSLVCVCQTLAAPIIPRISSNLTCLGPNDGVSSAQVNLAEINPLADVVTTGSLLTAQLALFNVSGLTAVLAGFPAPAGAPADVSITSQEDIPQGVTAAQEALKDVKVLFNANGNRTTQNLAEVKGFLQNAIASLQTDLTDCIKAAVASASVQGASTGTVATTSVPTGVPNEAALTTQTGIPTEGVFGTFTTTQTGIPNEEGFTAQTGVPTEAVFGTFTAPDFAFPATATLTTGIPLTFTTGVPTGSNYSPFSGVRRR